MTTNQVYCLATVGEANQKAFDLVISKLPGEWHLISTPAQLDHDFLDRVRPRAIFFPHWRWKVPAAIVTSYECIAFHSTDLPFGRGGSPIQNMIQIGKRTTKLAAFRMTEEWDAGPIYMKRELSLEGPLHQIFERISGLVAEMIAEIVREWPTPIQQEGTPTYFKRRIPAQSAIGNVGTAPELYDLIRMLDAPDYPRAFVEVGNFRIELKDAALRDDGVVEASAVIREKPK